MTKASLVLWHVISVLLWCNIHGEKIFDFARKRTRHPVDIPSRPSIVVSSNPNGADKVLKLLIAGGLSRSIAQITLYPIDALRTLAQTRDGRTIADVGVSSLARGCVTTSAFALFMGGIQFAVYEGCRNSLGPFLSSAMSAVSSCIVSVPQEVIKQRLVTGVYSSFREAITTIYTTEGVRGFYSAWKPTMLRNVPFVVTTFVTMDYLKNRRLRSTNREELTLSENVVVGMSSALVAVLLTQPADVVKTRMMTQAASTQLPYKTAVDCMAAIVTTEGPLTLFAGLKQRSIYMCSLWGMTFAMNGQINAYMKRSEEEGTK
jgi:solute carrier family 25 (mitochondrial S-adenosylmethionine transporter), member 26